MIERQPDVALTALRALVVSLPKAELHLHLEGTLEPQLMLAMAQRNGLEVSFGSPEELRSAYAFEDLQGFLDMYYAGCSVLRTEQDFFDLTWAYLVRAHADGVVHAEVFFDPQSHTLRGVALDYVISGITRALDQGLAKLGVSSRLIMCFLRHLTGEDALTAWHSAAPWLHRIDGVGLDSAEVGNPPEKFAAVYALAKQAGLRLVAHAGEEGPAEYVSSALDVLGVERIDHGCRVVDDPLLVDRLVREGIPLTMCPLSNQRLQVTPDLSLHPLKRLLDAGVVVTVNSDDPAYFGGYLVDNYMAIAGALGLDERDIRALAENSLRASWLPD